MSTSPTPLPERPDIGWLRRHARALQRSANAGDLAAVDRLATVAGDAEHSAPRLATAQLAVAREFGFESWPKLRAAVADANAAAEPMAASPIFREKHRDREAMFRPDRFLDGAKAAGWEPGPLPDAIIFVFHNVYTGLLDADDRFERNTALAPSNTAMFMTTGDGPRIAVTCSSVGAGALVGQIEHQVALGGASTFAILGTAGAISTGLERGDVVVVNAAVRDDGISGHYLPPDTYVDADEAVTSSLLGALAETGLRVHEGSTWTVPTPYRSTRPEVEHFADDGVLVSECEVASMLAVAESLGAAAGACLAVTGSLVDADMASAVRPASPAALLDAVVAAMFDTAERR